MTEQFESNRSLRPARRGAVLSAALALPGVAGLAGLAGPAHAEGAPTEGVIAYKYLYYKDSQPGLDRITVSSPSLYALVPLGSEWSVEGSGDIDTLGGATPRWYSSVSSASYMSEKRRAEDVRVARYFHRTVVGVGVAHSKEHDYESKAFSGDARISTEDNNSTLALGIGHSNDTIDKRGGLPGDSGVGEHKHTTDMLIGLTQVMTPDDVVLVNLTHSIGRGYFSDPYKQNDNRPRQRDSVVLLGQWNHYLERFGATARMSYRYYTDTFRIHAHTAELEWVQPINDKVVVTPNVRYYAQSSAFFYSDPLAATGFPPDWGTGYGSADQRLSAFGGMTLGTKVSVQIAPKWTVDAKVDYYEQHSNWRIGGKGSSGIETFRAQWYEVGVSYKF